MSKPTTEMLDTYFEELSHVDKEAERTWFKAGIAAYCHLCSPASEGWKKEYGFMEDRTMKRDEQMMNAAEAYAAGLYADEPVSFSTEEDRCVTMNDFCAGWHAADRCSRWIPVEEELPKVIDWYLCYNDLEDGCEVLHWEGDGNVWMDNDWHYKSKEVTHWMPMPMPPQPNKKDEKGWIPAPSGNPA